MPALEYPPFFAILRRFYDLDVNYVVIGGVAAILHGVLRATFDLDVVIDFDEKNVAKIIKVLEEFNLKPTVPIDPAELSDAIKRKEWQEKKNARVINFIDPEGIYRLDVALIYNYGEIKPLKITIDGVSVYVVGKEKLIQMKKAAGRDIDLRDIQYLQEL